MDIKQIIRIKLHDDDIKGLKLAKQLADGIEVIAFIKQVGGEAVPQCLEAALFG